jgi:hypothetical protein
MRPARATPEDRMPAALSVAQTITPLTAGAYASLPAAGTAGRGYLATDGPLLLVDSGSAWTAFGPLWKLTPPVDASFAWVNQGSATTDTTRGSVVLANTSNNSGSYGLNVRKIAAPGSTPYTVTALLMPQFSVAGTYTEAGICLRESSSGKLILFTVRNNAGAFQLLVSKFSSATASAGDYATSANALMVGSYWWMRISDDGTNRKCQFSRDGFNWQTYHSVGRTDYLTPNEVGYFIDPISDPCSCSVLHFVAG